MNYVFCGACEPLLFALYLRSLGKNITIITDDKNIAKYCTVENIGCIQFEKVKIAIKSIYKIFTLKRILDKTIEKIDIDKEDKFFLTTYVKSYESFYLAKEISKKGGENTVYFKRIGIPYEKFKFPWFKPIFIRGDIVKFAFKVVMDLDLMYRKSRGLPCFGIDDKFLKKYNIAEYVTDTPYEDLILDTVRKYKSNYEGFDNLIIGQGSLENIIKFDSLAEIYKNLSELIGEFAFKKHPIQSEGAAGLYLRKLLKDCEDIPEWIPVELYFNNIKKNVISVYSTSLSIASQFSHLNAISLLELVEWYDESFKRDVKRLLIKKSGNKIFFPKNFDELKEILLSN